MGWFSCYYLFEFNVCNIQFKEPLPDKKNSWNLIRIMNNKRYGNCQCQILVVLVRIFGKKNQCLSSKGT
jgi:hypothetical protein